MLDIILNSAKPIINQKIKEKCREKLNNGSDKIIINTSELEKILLDYLGIDYLYISHEIHDNGQIDLLLTIDKEALNGK